MIELIDILKHLLWFFMYGSLALLGLYVYHKVVDVFAMLHSHESRLHVLECIAGDNKPLPPKLNVAPKHGSVSPINPTPHTP